MRTLCVSLQVPGQLHGEDGVEQGGDESSIQAAHGPKHLEEQQPQRHAVLLQKQGQQRCCFTFQVKSCSETALRSSLRLYHLVVRNQGQHVLVVVGLAHPPAHLWIRVGLRTRSFAR